MYFPEREIDGIECQEYPYPFYENITWRFGPSKFDIQQIKADAQYWLDYAWSYITIRRTKKHTAEDGSRRMTLEHIHNLLKKSHRCLCCDRMMYVGMKYNKIGDSPLEPSKDRLNPLEPYSDKNVWLICKDCNVIKGELISPYEILDTERESEYTKRIADAWINVLTERDMPIYSLSEVRQLHTARGKQRTHKNPQWFETNLAKQKALYETSKYLTAI